MRILIAAGGTGGHVYPALAVAEAAVNHYPGTKLFFVGSVDGFERPLVEKAGVPVDVYEELQAGPVHGVSPFHAMRSSARMSIGTAQAVNLIRQQQPDVVLLTGGWVGLPVALAAWLMRVPSLIFVPDIEPALSIKVLRHLASKIALAIPESASYFATSKTIVTGYPIREWLEQGTRDEAIAHFNLNPSLKTLLVFGGSRGAQTINTALIGVLPQLLADDVQVIHVSGTLDYDRVCSVTTSLEDHMNYHRYPYLHDEMGLALAVADLVLSRSGAAVLGEFPLFGLPSVLVPYPYSWRYQKINADYLVNRGAAVLLPDEEMDDRLYTILQQLFTDEEQLATMRANVSRLAQHGSARRIAAILAELSGEDSYT